ncbi:MAG: hypothetical protein JNM30_15345 [Rhodospirillales bacterium]|nr:hypothetical protein [Rhodospirillales bacterium]
MLRDHAGGIAAGDLSVVPPSDSEFLRPGHRPFGLSALVWTAVIANPTAEWVAPQITEAFPWDDAPNYLIRDRDAVYGAAFKKRLRAMGIRDHPIAARSPRQNSHAERDRCGSSCSRSLAKDRSTHGPHQSLWTIFFQPILGGLHHHYVRT